MLLNSNLAAVLWWTAAFALVTAVDVVVWILALCHLPARRRNTILKIASVCWLMLPVAVACVVAAHDLMAKRIALNTAFFESSPQAHITVAHLMTQPQWQIGPTLIDWIPVYGDYGFWLLATLAVLCVPKDRISQRMRTAMGLVPFMFLMCSVLMLSG